jgi:hypothetical protein
MAPAPDTGGVSPTTLVAATIVGASAASITVTGPAGEVAGVSTLDPTTGVLSFSPTAPFEWATDYRAQVAAGSMDLTEWRFRTADEPTFEDYESFAPPSILRAADADAATAQVGIRFSPSVDGAVSAIRAYVGADAGVSHTGYLWGPEDALLTEVAFTGQAVDGWRTAIVTPAAGLTAGVEYRVTIQSSSAKYARVPNGLTAPVSNGFLSSPASGGVHGSGTGHPDRETDDGFPVDVVFDPAQ